MPRLPKQNPVITQQLASWHLKRVPFPSVSFVTYSSDDPLVNGSVFAKSLREHELYQIRHDLLKEGFPQGVKRWNWIWARKNMGKSLGMGKTALLAYTCDQINRDFGESFFGHAANWLALYVSVQPGAKTMDEVAAYALFNLCDTSRGFSVEQRLLARLRHRVIVQNESGRYPSRLASVVWHRFVNSSWLADHNVPEEILDEDVERLLLNSHVTASVAKAVSRGALRSHLAQLNGTPHSFPINQGLQHHALGILLNDVACIAEAATIAKVTIFLDDFYFIVRALPPAGREPVAAKIRKIAVDGPYESARRAVFNWIAVMHTQTAHTFQGAWHNAGVDLHAPLKWDEPNSVVLRGFTPEQGSVLLREFLRYKPNRLAQPPSEIHPFTDTGLSALALASQKKEASAADQSIVPRGLMESARFVLERALDAQIQAPIDANFIEHVFNGTLFLLPASDNDEEDESDTERPLSDVACPCGCHEDSTGEAFDVMAVISGSGNQRKAARHYCRNCNDTITIEAPES